MKYIFTGVLLFSGFAVYADSWSALSDAYTIFFIILFASLFNTAYLILFFQSKKTLTFAMYSLANIIVSLIIPLKIVRSFASNHKEDNNMSSFDLLLMSFFGIGIMASVYSIYRCIVANNSNG